MYLKKAPAFKAFNNIITQKTGKKLLHETSQEESNNRVFYSKFYIFKIYIFFSLYKKFP